MTGRYLLSHENYVYVCFRRKVFDGNGKAQFFVEICEVLVQDVNVLRRLVLQSLMPRLFCIIGKYFVLNT